MGKYQDIVTQVMDNYGNYMSASKMELQTLFKREDTADRIKNNQGK
jgi:hypothetical protein